MQKGAFCGLQNTPKCVSGRPAGAHDAATAAAAADDDDDDDDDGAIQVPR